VKLNQGCKDNPPPHWSLKSKGLAKFYVLRDEANVMDEVYLPRTRQQAKIWQFQVQNDISASIRQ
jgi:hypothetical protein